MLPCPQQPERRELPVNLSDYLAPNRVRFLASNTKEQALDELAGMLAATDAVTDPGAMREELAQREAQMSTGIGAGIAIPHTRAACVRRPVVAVGIQSNGIPDYEAMDGEPVRIVLMVVAGENDHDTYVHLLSEITNAIGNESVREAILAATDAQAAYVCLTTHSSPAG